MGQRIVIGSSAGIQSRLRGRREFPSPQSHAAQADMGLRVIGIDRQRPFVDLLRVAPAAQAQIQIGGLQEQARPHQVGFGHSFERGQRFGIAPLRGQHLRLQVIGDRRLVARQVTPTREFAPFVFAQRVGNVRWRATRGLCFSPPRTTRGGGHRDRRQCAASPHAVPAPGRKRTAARRSAAHRDRLA